ncbi:MAG: hypothetical protein ACRC8S_17400 [Fimbriiglobus sp.]
MQMYCPTCKIATAAAERCPQCTDRLVHPSEVSTMIRGGKNSTPDLIAPTIFARVLVGSLCTMGLFLGIRETSLGVVSTLLDIHDVKSALEPALTWAVRFFSILVGGCLAGCGRPSGGMTGFLTAALCAGLFGASDHYLGSKITLTTGIGACLLALTGLPMGFIGGKLWPPTIELPTGTTGSRGSSIAKLVSTRSEDDSEIVYPTAWVQLAVSVALALTALCVADTIRVTIRQSGGTMIYLGPHTLNPVINLSIGAGLFVLSGVLAGKGTGAGLRHGLIFGALTGFGVVILMLTGNTYFEPTLAGFFQLWGEEPANLRSVEALTPIFGITFFLGFASTVFGSILLPRLVKKRKRFTTLD